MLVKQHKRYLYTAANFSSYKCSIISFCPEPLLPPDGNLCLLQHHKVFQEMMQQTQNYNVFLEKTANS